jgi:hypothetical protein
MFNGTDDTSWWDDLIGGSAQKQQDQVPPPPTPQPPPVDQSAWEKSVEQHEVPDGTIHDVGLRIFQESKSYSDRLDSNEPIDAAREKMGWSILNGYDKWGADRQKHASTALPIEPSAEELRDPATLAAYQSSMKAAREAYLGWKDPTNGAVFFMQYTTPERSNHVFKNGRPQGVPISTQSGPYNNSYTRGQVPSRTVWLNTYWDR